MLLSPFALSLSAYRPVPAGAVTIPDPVAPSSLFVDDFTGPDNQLIRNRAGWQAYSAAGLTTSVRDAFGISANQARRIASNADYDGSPKFIWAHEVGATDAYFEIGVGTSAPRIVLAGTQSNQFFQINFNSTGAMVFSKIEAGTVTDLPGLVYSNARLPAVRGDLDRWGFRIVGSKLRLFVNGIMATDVWGIEPREIDLGAFAKGGLYGWSSFGDGTTAKVDNVTAYAVTGGTITLTAPPVFWPAEMAFDAAEGMELPQSTAMPLSGTYTGLVPNHVDYRVLAYPTGAVVQDWQPLADAAIGAGAWSGTGMVPPGMGYRIEVRKRNDTSCWDQAFSEVAVGPVVLIYGQSYAGGRVGFGSGGYTADPRAFSFDRNFDGVSDNRWEKCETGGNATPLVGKLADMYGARMGRTIPVGSVGGGKSGVNIETLYPSSTTTITDPYGGGTMIYWQMLVRLITAAGAMGKAVGIIWDQGTGSETPGEQALYASRLNETITEIRAQLAGGRNIPALVTIVPSYTGGGNTDAGWFGVRRLNARQPGVTANTHIGNHTVGCAKGDVYHLTNAPGGVGESNRRAGLTLVKLLSGAGYNGRGPKAAGTATRAGAVITIPVDLNDATSIAASGNLTGYRVAADADLATPLTISSAVLSGNNVVITLAADPGGRVYVGSFYGQDPDAPPKAGAVWVIGTYADATTIPMEPIVDPIRTAS